MGPKNFQVGSRTRDPGIFSLDMASGTPELGPEILMNNLVV